MGIYTFGPPKNLVLSLREMFDISTFVETGTFKGETSVWASENFSSVITVEAAEELFNANRLRFSAIKNLTAYNGSSPVVLQKLVPELPSSIFWLDAHWCGGITAGPANECPLIAELSILIPWFHRHIILIDDARLFVRPPPSPHKRAAWPSIDDIMRCVGSSAQTYTTMYKDVLTIVPSVHRDKVSEMIQILDFQDRSEE